jgi:CBS domain-containing protein
VKGPAQAVQGADYTGSHHRVRGLSQDGFAQSRRRVADGLQCSVMRDPYRQGWEGVSIARPIPVALESLISHRMIMSSVYWNQDVTTRVIAGELKLEETPVSKVMTRNPTFVLADTLAVAALQKMVQGACAAFGMPSLHFSSFCLFLKPLVSGKFRHLPVVENGEVIALLDIAKCLYDGIARMERAAEEGKAIAAAVEGVEKHWGTAVSGL